MGTLEFAFTETSYQTAPLEDYRPELLERAGALFKRIVDRAGPSRAKQFKGSFSVFAASSDATAAKIIIYESGKGKVNGHDPGLTDGVYVLIRVHGATGRTLGVAPMHHERFAYFRLIEAQPLDEMADFIASCAAAQ